jgi:hypothetical protein
MRWAKVDLHNHTPGSSDYLDKNATFMDILRTAEERELDAIAITDHNSVAGVAGFRRRLETLQFLEQEKRLSPEEAAELDEYHRILNKVLLLPGFELTATLGFHILAIFPPQTSIRKLEHILLELNVPEDRLDLGSSEIGASTDVLTAYSVMDRAGALVIAAHANSTHGVAMQNFNFGGQTKIAYTQDHHLHALEVTDLDSRSRRSTAQFYNGSKPEYPRRMHCIQGSDSHRLVRDAADNEKRLGIGDRATEMYLPEVSFEAIKDLLTSDDFTRTRPYRPADPLDAIRQAQEAGPSLVVSFHERPTVRSRGYEAVLRDIVAFANTNGGTLYIGAGKTKNAIRGVEKPQQVQDELLQEIQSRVTPQLEVSIDSVGPDNKPVLVVNVPKGTETPYVLGETEIWVRQESETVIATRDELVRLVLQTLAENRVPVAMEEAQDPIPSADTVTDEAPHTGVEIVDTTERNGIPYHTVKDLRNGSVVQNVTRFSARRLWRYAISERESGELDMNTVRWEGDIGVWKVHKRGGQTRYNLVQRDPDGRLHIYYGVTDDGLHGPWRVFAEAPDPAEEQTADGPRPEPAEEHEAVPVG